MISYGFSMLVLYQKMFNLSRSRDGWVGYLKEYKKRLGGAGGWEGIPLDFATVWNDFHSVLFCFELI